MARRMRSGPKQALSETIRAFAASRAKLESAIFAEQRIPSLTVKLEEKMLDIRKKATESNFINAHQLNQLVHDTAEQGKIEEIRQQRKEAQAEIHDLCRRAHLQLVQLAGRLDDTGVVAARIMDSFKSLPPYTTIETTDAIIGLLKHLADGIKATKRGTRSAALENVKNDIRKWKKERASYEDICNRLADRARPPGATWSHLPWPDAFKQCRNAVWKWMSFVVNH